MYFQTLQLFFWDQIQFIKKAFKHYKHTNVHYVYLPTQHKLLSCLLCSISDDFKSSLFCTNEGDVFYKLTNLTFQIASGKYDS